LWKGKYKVRGLFKMKQFVKDQMGTSHHFTQIPRKIVSLVPSQTELLFDLGLNKEIIGITRFLSKHYLRTFLLRNSKTPFPSSEAFSPPSIIL